MAKNKKVSAIQIKDEFLAAVNNGKEYTVSEWADHFYPDSKNASTSIYRMMNEMRKKGHMLFPIPLNGPNTAGVVKNVTKDSKWFSHVFNRHAVFQTEGSVNRAAQYAEVLIENHPKLRDDVVKIFESIVKRATESNKKLLGIPYARTVSRK